MADMLPYPGAPRWVKVSGIVVGILILLLVGLIVVGGIGHGPGRNASAGDSDSRARLGLLLLLGILVLVGAAPNWRWLVGRGLPRPGGSSVRRRALWGRTVRLPVNMTTGLRKLVLTAHVTSSVGSLGAVAVFLALAVVGLTSQDAQTVRTAYIANELIAWYIILPLILTALLIGLVQSLSTPWGLFRHYWVLAKLMLTLVTLYILLTQMEGISFVAGVAAETTLSGDDLLGMRRTIRTHAAGGLAVLLMLVAISVYKPQGMTRHGWRKRHEKYGSHSDNWRARSSPSAR